MAGAGGIARQKQLNVSAIVKSIISPTVFTCSVTGFRDNFFQNWVVYAASKVDGSGAAPEGEGVECVSSLRQGGQITLINPFGRPLTPGDEVYLIHPYVASNTIMTCFPSNNTKESSPDEVTTNSVPYVKVKEISFTGKQGGARVKFDLRVDNVLGTAFAVIYKNGVPVPTITPPFYTIFSTSGIAYTTCSQDVYGLVTGDLIQIYARTNAITRTAFVRNLTVGYDYVSFPSVGIALNAVDIDPVGGFAGTAWPIGSPGTASNNLTDALIIAAYRNTNTFHIKNKLVLDQDLLSPYNFTGDGDWFTSGVNLNNHDVANSTFINLAVEGSSPGFFTAFGCFVTGSIANPAILSMVDATLNNCLVGSIAGIPLGFGINALNCTSWGPPYLGASLSGGGIMAWVGGQGDLSVINMDNAASFFYLSAISVSLNVLASCTAGLVQIAAAAIVFVDLAATVTLDDEWTFAPGKHNVLYRHVIFPANSGSHVMWTATDALKIVELVLQARGAATPDLTTAGIYGGPGDVLTMLDPIRATRANLAVNGMLQQAEGPWILEAGDTIDIDLVGTGPGATNLGMNVVFEPIQFGAYLQRGP